MGRLSTFFLLFAILFTGGVAFGLEDDEGNRILSLVDQAMAPESFQSFSIVENILPNGRKLSVTLFLAANGQGKTVALIVSPESMRGRSALWDGTHVWMHVPGELEPRKNDLGQSLVGGVFNNMDLFCGAFAPYHQAQLERENQDYYFLKLEPKRPDLPYAFLTMSVNKKLHIPNELVQYVNESTVFKKIQFSNIATFANGKNRPSRLETFSQMNPRYQSVWTLGRMEKKTFPEEVFSVEKLSKLGYLLK